MLVGRGPTVSRFLVSPASRTRHPPGLAAVPPGFRRCRARGFPLSSLHSHPSARRRTVFLNPVTADDRAPSGLQRGARPHGGPAASGRPPPSRTGRPPARQPACCRARRPAASPLDSAARVRGGLLPLGRQVLWPSAVTGGTARWPSASPRFRFRSFSCPGPTTSETIKWKIPETQFIVLYVVWP